MMMKTKKLKTTPALLIISSIFIILSTGLVVANPTGISISGNVTETAGITSPSQRTDDGGTITTLVVDVLQQNNNWKAYVGNLSGVLTLDDSSGQSIFRWELEDEDVNGNVFITRSNTIDWSTISCSGGVEVEAEDTFLGFSSSQADSINRTFNESVHPALDVGGTIIGADTCKSTHTFVSSNTQAQSSANYPLILLGSGTNIIYATPVNKGAQSYSTGNNLDFQSIVPDQSTGTTSYYFYAEIGA